MTRKTVLFLINSCVFCVSDKHPIRYPAELRFTTIVNFYKSCFRCFITNKISKKFL